MTASLPFGPGEAFVATEILEMVRQGHEVLVVPVRPRGTIVHQEGRELAGLVEATSLVSARVIAAAARVAARRPLRALRALRLALAPGFRVVTLKNLSLVPKGLWLADLAERRHCDHIHAHWASAPASLALLANEAGGCPFSFTAYRWDIAENNLLDTKVRRAAFARAHDGQGQQELAERACVPAAAVTLLHTGIVLPRRAPTMPADHALRVVVPANLVEKKGHCYLLEAVAMLRTDSVVVDVTLAGDGPLRVTLEAQARELDIADRVRFTGVVPHRTLLERMAAGEWNVMALPSIETPSGEKEGIPISLTEAMACGLPVLSTRTGGIPELLAPGTGLMVTPASADALYGALKALAADPERREALGRAGRRRVEEMFAVDVIVRRLVGLMAGSRGAAAA